MIYKDAIKKLCLKLCSNVSKDVFVAYDELCQIISKMKTGIKNFENERSPESDMCKYVLEALKLINLVEMLVAADRDGKWKLHLAVAEELMQVFLEFDSINYVRHAPWYLEQIKALENPYLNGKLIQGHFVVKDKRGKLNSVSPDMKLEQTIQKASEDPGEIIGNLVFYETHLIDDVFHNLTRSKIRHGRDTNINYELIGTGMRKNFNEMVQQAVKVISSQGNISTLQQSASSFRNLLTRQNFPTDVS